MAALMSSMLALSVSGKIEQYGAYAGFASVLGLAVLSLLYFAQAREVKRLREWAGRAPERDAELQQRVQAEASRRVVAQPQPQPQRAAAAPATPAAATAAAPQVAAGPVKPGQPLPAPATAVTPATAAGQAAGAGGAVSAAAATAAGAAAKAVPAGAAPATPPATPPPPPGGPQTQATTVRPATAAGNGAPTQPPRPGQPLRVPSARAATPPPPPAEPPRSRRSVLAIGIPIAAVLAILVVAAVLLLGGGSSDNATKSPKNTIAAAPSQNAGNSPASAKAGSATLKPSGITTGVLNGTTVPGLARGVANRLQNAGFKIGNVTNAADQSRSQTIVEYGPGRRREALLVAKAIDVGTDAVQALSAGSRSIAGSEAIVVVTVGSDQNTSPQQHP
jgi:hypothetical protein